MKLTRILGVVIVFIALILIGGVIYQQIEGWRFLDSVYFATMTVTTIGYGDFVPQTDAGKLFTIIFSFSGIAMAFYVFTNLGKYIFSLHLSRSKHIDKEKQEKKVAKKVKKVVKAEVKKVKKEVERKLKKVRKVRK